MATRSSFSLCTFAADPLVVYAVEMFVFWRFQAVILHGTGVIKEIFCKEKKSVMILDRLLSFADVRGYLLMV